MKDKNIVFCNKKSLNIGSKVYLKKEKKYGYISDVGILGSKLSIWRFLYHINDENEKEISCCIDDNIEIVK